MVGHEIEEKFSQVYFKPIETIESVLLHAAKGLPISSELNQLSLFYDDFNNVNLELEAQLKTMRNLFTSENDTSSNPLTVTGIATKINSTEGANLFMTEVSRLLKLALVVPATSADSRLSGLRRLKTYLRSTIGQARLNHLMVLHCHQDRVDQLNLQAIAQEFISANEKQSKFFENFYNVNNY